MFPRHSNLLLFHDLANLRDVQPLQMQHRVDCALHIQKHPLLHDLPVSHFQAVYVESPRYTFQYHVIKQISLPPLPHEKELQIELLTQLFRINAPLPSVFLHLLWYAQNNPFSLLL